MSIKPGLTRLEHEELGAKLKQLRDEALRIALHLDHAYSRTSLCARLSYRAAQTLDKLRSALDHQAFLNYCQWDTLNRGHLYVCSCFLCLMSWWRPASGGLLTGMPS
jgi:hypothetical protein